MEGTNQLGEYLGTLYQTHYPEVLEFALDEVGDHGHAEDIANEAFLTAFSVLKNGNPERVYSDPCAFLRKAAGWAVSRHSKREKGRRKSERVYIDKRMGWEPQEHTLPTSGEAARSYLREHV